MNPIPLIRSIGATVREKRISLGLTQNELAEQAGVSERLVRSVEMGTAYGIGLEKLINIIAPLGLSLNVTNAEDKDQCHSKGSKIVSQGADYSSVLKNTVLGWTRPC